MNSVMFFKFAVTAHGQEYMFSSSVNRPRNQFLPVPPLGLTTIFKFTIQAFRKYHVISISKTYTYTVYILTSFQEENGDEMC